MDTTAPGKECCLIKDSGFSGTGNDVSPKLLFSFALYTTQVKQENKLPYILKFRKVKDIGAKQKTQSSH